MSTLIEAVEEVQSWFSNIDDLKKVVSAPPPAINFSDLPLAWVVPKSGTWSPFTPTINKQVRQFQVFIFVSPLTFGLPEKTYQDLISLIDTVGRHLAGVLYGPEFNYEADRDPSFSDSGISVLEFSGTEYHGFTVTINLPFSFR